VSFTDRITSKKSVFLLFSRLLVVAARSCKYSEYAFTCEAAIEHSSLANFSEAVPQLMYMQVGKILRASYQTDIDRTEY